MEIPQLVQWAPRHWAVRVGVPLVSLAGVALIGGGLGSGGSGVRSPIGYPLPGGWGSAVTPVLVFDGITVIDVEHGRRLPDERVVIVGNHIQTMGRGGAVRIPAGARVIDARGTYLIPGLWDMHTHTTSHPQRERLEPGVNLPVILAMGVTGIRDAGSGIPIDTLRQWQREILAGTRVGPPRMILSGHSLADNKSPQDCVRSTLELRLTSQTCVVDSADARHLVDSIAAAGADMIKPRKLSRAMYFVVAAEARKLHIPFGGHIENVTALEALDSGAVIVDHEDWPSFHPACLGDSATVAQCAPVAAHFRAHQAWLVLTEFNYIDRAINRGYLSLFHAWLGGDPWPTTWLRDAVRADVTGADLSLRVMRDAGMPLLAGSDEADRSTLVGDLGAMPAELAYEVQAGLTPLEGLQTATLNPARFLHATDSLGTVAPGKLADLVVLDGDPLADITNITRIHAVVANGRYYDRAALDQLLVDAHAVYASVFGDSVLKLIYSHTH